MFVILLVVSGADSGGTRWPISISSTGAIQYLTILTCIVGGKPQRVFCVGRDKALCNMRKQHEFEKIKGRSVHSFIFFSILFLLTGYIVLICVLWDH